MPMILPGDSFSTGTEATARDITILITKLAYYLAQVYFIQKEGHEPDTARPGPHTAYLLSQPPRSGCAGPTSPSWPPGL
jgi:hypothetical protein